MSRARSLLFSIVALVPLSFCALGAECGLDVPNGLDPEADGIASDTTEAEPVVAIATTLTALPAFVLDETTTSLAQAVARQADLPSKLDTPSCLTVGTSGNVVTYEMDGCRGPWGISSISGSETATFSAVGDRSFQIDLQSNGLVINGEDASLTGTMVISIQDDGTRTVTWTGHGSGTTPAGRAVTFEPDLDLTLAPDGSSTIDGSLDLTIGLRNLGLDFQDLSRSGPRGTCPSGTVVVTAKLTQLKLTLTFDGTDQVYAESALGGHDTYDLICTSGS